MTMMSLYSFCLKTVISKNLKTSELPHKIQDDVTVLNRFKTKLHEWHRVLGYVEEEKNGNRSSRIRHGSTQLMFMG